MSASLTESELREILANDLDLVEPDLSLVKQEYRLRNKNGADGFVDILARDDTGVFVVIELKRSDQTARQAFHELNKYVSLLASDRGLRLDQVRCILVSTSWHELLVPFTRFMGQADYSVAGKRLVLNEEGKPVRSERVELPDLPTGNEVCPYYLGLFFSETRTRDDAADTLPKHLQDFSVDDFVLYQLDKTDDIGNVIYPFGLILVLAEFNEAMREHLWALFPEQDEDEAASDWWFEQVVQHELVQRVDASEVNCLTPNTGGIDDWRIVDISGFGSYAENLVWTEERLRGVLRGAGDSNSTSYEATAAVAHKASWTRLREKLMESVSGCGEWPRVLEALLEELEASPDAKANIYAYAPADILRGLEALQRLSSSKFLPDLAFGWKDGPNRSLVRGCLVWNKRTIVTSPEATLSRAYPDHSDYFFQSMVGNTRDRETYLCELHGLSYRLVEVVTDECGDVTSGPDLLSYKHELLERTPVSNELESFSEFSSTHEVYLQRLSALFSQNIFWS